MRVFRPGEGEGYREVVGAATDRLKATEPFEIDIAVTDLLPYWAR